MLARRQRLAAWRACGDCSFVPVCAGGCSVAASAEHGDMEAPACHKPAFEAALATFARVTTQEAQS
jgi:radical SAM protein with 4Fe4S-binding SPASM domain